MSHNSCMASCKDDTHKCTNGALAQDKRKVCRLSGSQLVRVFCQEHNLVARQLQCRTRRCFSLIPQFFHTVEENIIFQQFSHTVDAPNPKCDWQYSQRIACIPTIYVIALEQTKCHPPHSTYHVLHSAFIYSRSYTTSSRASRGRKYQGDRISNPQKKKL